MQKKYRRQYCGCGLFFLGDYLTQHPGEPLFFSHFAHFAAPSLQHSAVCLYSPQLSQIVLASASLPQPDKKARQREVIETISICFMGRQPRFFVLLGQGHDLWGN